MHIHFSSCAPAESEVIAASHLDELVETADYDKLDSAVRQCDKPFEDREMFTRSMTGTATTPGPLKSFGGVSISHLI